MTNGDLINLAAYLEGKPEPDLSEYDAGYIGAVIERSFRTTKADKEKIEAYFDKYILGVSLNSLLSAAPKAKKPFVNPNQSMNSTHAPHVSTSADARAKSAIKPPTDNVSHATNPISKTTNTTDKSDDDGFESSGNDKFEVLTDEQRWEWARSERKLLDGDVITMQLKKQDYPFIIDPNKAISLDNFDMPMAIYMVETGRIKYNEPVALCQSNDAKRMLDMKPDQLGLDGCYTHESNFVSCLMRAKDNYAKYKEMLDEPEPTREETIERFATYMIQKAKPVHPEYRDCLAFMDVVTNVDNDTIYFATNDEDEADFRELKYDNADNLLNDLLLLSDIESMNVNKNTKYQVFRKKISLNKHVADTYDRYPNGYNGNDFYTTRLEAYEMGALKL